MGDLSPGTEIAGYRIESVAGRGGMGVVYRAVQIDLGRVVALKVIAPGLLDDAQIRERFLRESRIAAAIEHPHVVPIHAAGEVGGVAFIAMRFVAGHDLVALVREEGALSPPRAAALVAQVAEALDAAHEAGLVHRDVKPANILIGRRDHGYLGDFGLARHALSTAGLTATGSWVGTLDYIAPEQIRGERVDERTDVYALGCVLYYALTGEVPFPREGHEARLWAHLHAAPPQPSAHAAAVSPALDDVVAKAMAKRPADRFPSAGALGRAALAAAAGTAPRRRRRAPAAEMPTLVDVPVSRRGVARRGRLPAAGLLLAALGAGILVAVLANGADEPRKPAGPAGATPARSVAAGSPQRVPEGKAPKVFGRVAVNNYPTAIVAAGGNVWTGGPYARALARVDARTVKRRRGRKLGRGVIDLAVRDGTLWVALRDRHLVVRLRASDGRPAGGSLRLAGEPSAIDAGEGAIWVGERQAAGPTTLLRIDPRTLAHAGRGEFGAGIREIRVALGAVWVLLKDRPAVAKVDPDRGRVLRTYELEPTTRDFDYASGYLWITHYGDSTVTRLDPRTGELVPIGVPSKPNGISARSDGVWVACTGDQSIVRFDPQTARVTGDPIPVGLNPIGIDAGERTVWVTNAGDDSVTRVDLR